MRHGEKEIFMNCSYFVTTGRRQERLGTIMTMTQQTAWCLPDHQQSISSLNFFPRLPEYHLSLLKLVFFI